MWQVQLRFAEGSVECNCIISENCPEVKGFNRRGLYRMKQFYETYKGNEFVSPLVTQISWTNHLLILSSTKTDEEREFYIKLCLKEKYSKRELGRQLDSGYFERYMLSTEKFSEHELKKAIIANLKDFILEIGKDFTFVGEEYRVMVGNSDYYIDLLFYHRGLTCLVAFELKIGAFKPEHIGKIKFDRHRLLYSVRGLLNSKEDEHYCYFKYWRKVIIEVMKKYR